MVIAKHRTPPEGMPKVAFGNNGELCSMDDVTCEKNSDGLPVLPDARHAEMRRAYRGFAIFSADIVYAWVTCSSRTGV